MAILVRHGRLTQTGLQDAVLLAERALPFPDQPVRRESWIAPSGSVALVVWSNEPGDQVEDGLIVVQPDGAKTLAGLAIAPGIRQPWKPWDVCNQMSFTDGVVSRLDGTFALVKANSDPPSIHVFNTISRWMPVYWAEQGEVIVVSNRAMLINLVITGQERPVYDPVAIGTFLPTGFYRGDASPFWGVNVMPAHSRLMARTNGVVIRPYHDALPVMDRVELTSDAVEELANLAVRSARWMSVAPVTVGLSGGRDSRLIAAILKSAGVAFVAETRGFEDSPEVILGKRVASALDVPHRSVRDAQFSGETESLTVNPLSRATSTILQADGMISAWENIYLKQFSGSVRAGGEGSSGLHDGLVRLHRKPHPPTWQEVRAILLQPHVSRRDLLTPEVMARQELAIGTWLEKVDALGPTAALSYAGVDLNVSRWVGPMVNGRVDAVQAQPLMFEQFVKAALSMQMKAKIAHVVAFRVTEYLNPGLVQIPMTGTRFPFESKGPVAGDEAGWLNRTPLQFVPGSRAAFDWRHRWTAEMYELFFETIFRNRASDSLFEAVQREPIEAWFTSRRGQPSKQMDSHFAWALLTASVMLENRWSDHSFGGSPINIPLPDA